MSTFSDTDPIVQTTNGKVRGKLRTTVYDDQFYCFDGIPYAQPPLGKLRFKTPREVESWHDILDCTEVAQKCLQYNRYIDKNEGSEDCLYLNVYAKKLQSEKPLPVMVYLYGGGFTTGTASRLAWGPDYFMMQDVIFITIGYRVGTLGFLSLSDPTLEVPGNAGLKDIVLALKWIKRNCHNFNGDSENITLFGHSAGSQAAQLLLLHEPCKGLFHKAILMAGYTIDMQKLPQLEYRLACHIGYEGAADNEKQIYDYLSTADAHKLVGFNFWTEEEKARAYGNYVFLTVVEPYITAETIMPAQPVEKLPNAWGNSIPIMLGSTSCEALAGYDRYSSDESIYELHRKHPEYLLPVNLKHKYKDLETQRVLVKKLIEVHFGDKAYCMENFESALEFTSYRHFYHSQNRMVNARLAYSSAPTYLYRFDFDSPTFNLYRVTHSGPNVRGAGHVDELSYIFYMPASFKLDRNSTEFQTILRMINMWTAFANNSDPNTTAIESAIWKPLERSGAVKCLNISNDLSFIEAPETSKCNDWDKIYKDAGVKLF